MIFRAEKRTGAQRPEEIKRDKSFSRSLLHAITHAYGKIGCLTLSPPVSHPRQGNDKFGHY